MRYQLLILLLLFLHYPTIASKSMRPLGEHSVGSKSYFLVDSRRKEILTIDTTDFRRIAIQTFYPSLKCEKCKSKLESPYSGKIKYSHCLDIEILPIEKDKKYPIVILSPGFGGSFLMNMTLAEDLASNGYFVINVGHTFFNTTSTFPDGKNIEVMSMDTLQMGSNDFLDMKFRTSLNRYIKIQKDDIVSILDHLSSTIDEKHLDQVDLNNIACIGYSGGGATAAEICSSDSRIKAGVNINGVIYGDAWEKAIKQPFLYINADYSNPKKAEVKMQGGQNTIDSLMRFYELRKSVFIQSSENDFYELTLNNTTHQNFSDYALVNRKYSGNANAKKCLSTTYLYIRSFLDKYLKEKTSEVLDSNLKTKEYSFELVKARPKDCSIVLNHFLIVVDSTTYQAILDSELLYSKFSYGYEKNKHWEGIYLIGQDNYIEIFHPKSFNDEILPVGFSWVCQASLKVNHLENIDLKEAKMIDYSSDKDYDYLSLYTQDSSNLITTWEMNKSQYESWTTKSFNDSLRFETLDYNSPAESDSSRNYIFNNVTGIKIELKPEDSISTITYLNLVGYHLVSSDLGLTKYSNSKDFIELDFVDHISIPTISTIYLNLDTKLESNIIRIGNSELHIDGNSAKWLLNIIKP